MTAIAVNVELVQTRNESEDARLVRQCLGGSKDAFTSLVTKYQDRVYNAVLRMCRKKEDAEELVQEAFLKAFEKLDTFRGKSSFYTWLFRIAMNLTLTHCQKIKRSRAIFIGNVETEMAAYSQSNEPLPEQVLLSAEERVYVLDAIESLEPNLRSVVVLRETEGLKYREIAEVMKIPVGTVKSRLSLAREQLKMSLLPFVA